MTRRPPANSRLDAEPLEHRADLRPAAMHHHRIDRGLLQQHDVAREAARQLLVAHGVAAVLHDDDLLVVALHVRQRLGEECAAARCGRHGRFCRLNCVEVLAARIVAGVRSQREACAASLASAALPRQQPRDPARAQFRRSPCPSRDDVAITAGKRRGELRQRGLGLRHPRRELRRLDRLASWSARPGGSPPRRRAP